MESAVSVAVVREGRILLVLRANEPAKGLWAFPGGRVEGKETLEAAAAREVFEETGLSVSELVPLDEMILGQPPGSVFHLTVFQAGTGEGHPEASNDAADAGFFSLADIADMALTDSTRRLAERLLSMS